MTSTQRAMLQLQRHALQIVRLFTGEELPAAPLPLAAAREAAGLPGFDLALA